MYLEFTIFCPDEAKELVEAELMNAGFEGVWENNDCICLYVKEEDLDMEILKSILTQYNLIESYTYKPIENINWNADWESSFEPIQIGDKCLIRADFHPTRNLPYEIVITPKMSFGTGHHETTYLMAETLLDTDLKNKTILDMGCGTSVLSILAEKLGASQILAIDNDDWAIENSKENIEYNKCNNISVFNNDACFSGKFDIIVSNINRNINLELLQKYAPALNQGGKILLSGFYNHDVPPFENLVRTLGLKIALVKERNSWACIIIDQC
ncbi:MAG: 50S ribosomal protein L11 methyltransferase [Bacteroidia bacterium]